MSTPYLNPVELLGLAGNPTLSLAELRKAKKRFLMKMEVDWKEDFDFHGQLFTRNDLDRVIDEANDEDMFTAYAAAAGIPGLSAFLTSGQVSRALTGTQLANPRLTPLLKSYFAPAFNQAYGRAVAAGDHLIIKKMSNWATGITGIRDAELYAEAYRLLDGRVDKVNHVVAAYLHNAASPEGRRLKGMKIFQEVFPAGILANLPPYFKDITNKLTGLIIPAIVTLNNDHKNPKMALALANKLKSLPHLSPTYTDELKKITKQLRGNVSSRTSSSSDSGISPARIIWLIIVACVMMFRIATCANQSSRSSNYDHRFNQTPYDNFRVSPDVNVVMSKHAKNKYINELRLKVYQGKNLRDLNWPMIAGTPPAAYRWVKGKDPGVVEANLMLKALYVDTIDHQAGILTDTVGIVQRLKDKAAVEQLIATREVAKALGISGGNSSNQSSSRVTPLSTDADIVVSAERPSPVPDVTEEIAPTVEPKLPPPVPVSYREKQQTNYLGPKARLPDNYLLYPTGSERNDGRLMKIRGMVDDYELGALIIWRDTVGIRQVKISGAKSIPTTFNVAVGQIDKLLDAYIVYGKKWSEEAVSPWGAKGWFQEVTCYCGPKDHKGFINGKKDYRKNFWLPGSTIDPRKSMTPTAFARGIRGLR